MNTNTNTTLTATQQTVLDAVTNGARTVQAIVTATGLAMIVVRSTVVRLVKAELVTSADGEVNLVPEVVETEDETVAEKGTRKVRQCDPNSLRQQCFALIRKRMAAGAAHKVILAELEGELYGIGHNLATRYIQRVRGADGLVKPRTKKEVAAEAVAA